MLTQEASVLCTSILTTMLIIKQVKIITCAIATVLFITALHAQRTLTVKVNEPKAEIQPTMWGVFFEDINLGADGGIYAELVKNRSFEFFRPLMGWAVQQKQFKEGSACIKSQRRKHFKSALHPRYSKQCSKR